MKQIPVKKAIGTVLCHDITAIDPEKRFKGPAFKKGHVIQPSDIEKLLDLGKRHLYVFEMKAGKLHENEAARRIAVAAAGANLSLSDPSEGKVQIAAAAKGLLKINSRALNKINRIHDIIFSTLHSNQIVHPNQDVAGTRIIPLITDEKRIRRVETICQTDYPLIQVKPLQHHKVGIIITGSEVYRGRIQDQFGPVILKKFEQLGSEIIQKKFVSDDVEMTIAAIHSMMEAGAQIIAITGGMSVDPDDQTPVSIRRAGAHVISYGAPVLPGAMFMMAYLDKVPIVGLPGCVMYFRTSIFDLVVPRILAGEAIKRADIAAMGHGGFCAACDRCRFPKCAFGKGS